MDENNARQSLIQPESKRNMRRLCIAVIVVILIGAGITVGLLFFFWNRETIPDLSKSAIYSNTKETELMFVNGVHVFGVKDHTGNVQGIHAIQTSDTVYTIDNYLLTQIQSTEYTLQFNYNVNDTKTQYYVMITSENSSYEIPSVYNTPMVNFSQFEVEFSMKDNISNPFTGILIELTDSISQQSISDATLHLNYQDNQSENRSVVMINLNAGRYYALLPIHDPTMDKYFQTKNLQETVPLQVNSLIELIQAYPMSDICSKVSQMAKSFCDEIKQEMSSKIPDALRTASKYTNHIPLRSNTSTSTKSQFEIVIRIPGEDLIIEPLDDVLIDPTILTMISRQAKTSKGKCNEQTVAGDNTPDDRRINIGKGHVAINFHYETYTVQDQIDVYYTGKNIFPTGCVGTEGERVKTLSLDANEAYLTVKVTPNCAGGSDTKWYYAIECPNNELTCKGDMCYCGFHQEPSRQVLPPTFDGCGQHRDWYIYWFLHGKGELWKFTPICDRHDRCYGTCNTNRQTCESAFCSDLDATCEANWSSDTDIYYRCLSDAATFCLAVKAFGSSSFYNAQNEDCWCDKNSFS